MKYHRGTLILILLLLLTAKCFGQTPKKAPSKIQIAFLLDVSQSMDLMIQKAKSQFWRLANYVGSSIKNGEKPSSEFALVTYGLDHEKDYCQILTDLNADIDSVATHLHQILVGGSIEHCWTTLNKTLDELQWSKQKDDLKLIIIAGNESFNQGPKHSKKIIRKARKMQVIINTVYCSSSSQNSTHKEWQKAAQLTKGSYFSISLEDSLNLEESFLDKKLIEFNDKLNQTYLPFGPSGQKSFDRMILQDQNSRMAGIPFFRERLLYKAGEAFINPSWDLVDAILADSTLLGNPDLLKWSTLHFEDKEQLLEFVNHTHYLRETYKETIKLRYEKIKKYLGEHPGDKDLDQGVKSIILKEGRKRGFAFTAK